MSDFIHHQKPPHSMKLKAWHTGAILGFLLGVIAPFIVPARGSDILIPPGLFPALIAYYLIARIDWVAHILEGVLTEKTFMPLGLIVNGLIVSVYGALTGFIIKTTQNYNNKLGRIFFLLLVVSPISLIFFEKSFTLLFIIPSFLVLYFTKISSLKKGALIGFFWWLLYIIPFISPGVIYPPDFVNHALYILFAPALIACYLSENVCSIATVSNLIMSPVLAVFLGVLAALAIKKARRLI